MTLFQQARRLFAQHFRSRAAAKRVIQHSVRLLRTQGIRGFSSATLSALHRLDDYEEWVASYDRLTPADSQRIAVRVAALQSPPKISVIMPVYRTDPDFLAETIDSVVSQLYPHWELCIADDFSQDARLARILKRYSDRDSRIKVVFRDENGHISAASNSALALATGDWVAFLDHDDLLAPHALFCVADAIAHNPELRLIYSDEDKVTAHGSRLDHYFKPDWNPALFHSHNLITHLSCYRRDLVTGVGGLRTGFEGAQDYDLALRCVERIRPDQIHHIPLILYHWRMVSGSTASDIDFKPYAMQAGERALNEHFARQRIAARAALAGFGYRVDYALPEEPPLVSIIVPTRNGRQLVEQCITSIRTKTSYSPYEIILVDNGSDDPEALSLFAEFEARGWLRIRRDDRPFNYSALNNAAVAAARGSVVALLNNDVEVIGPDWLTVMVSLALQPQVGAVGAMLYYPNNTIQHAGVIIGVGGVAGHASLRLFRGETGYKGRAALCSDFSAVTGACLVVQRRHYEAVGGLNETDLTVAFNDVDFCLRLQEAGLRNVWTPYAELYHHESASRGYETTPEKAARFAGEESYMKRRWAGIIADDPAYSPNLTLLRGDFSLARPPRAVRPWLTPDAPAPVIPQH